MDSIMTGYLIHQSDLTEIHNYMEVLRNLAQFTRSFKVGLDLVPAREYGSYRIPEIEKHLKKAADHLPIWSEVVSGITALHKELEAFMHSLIQSSESIKSSHEVTRPFIERNLTSLGELADAFEKRQETLQTLIRGIYTILPRITDFMNREIYRHAHQYNLVEKRPDQNTAMQNLTASYSFVENGPALSPQARLIGGYAYIQRSRRQYEEAYGAATHVSDHLTRICDLLASSILHTLKMRRNVPPSRPYVETRLMLVSLQEIQRLTQRFNSLTGNPAAQ